MCKQTPTERRLKPCNSAPVNLGARMYISLSATYMQLKNKRQAEAYTPGCQLGRVGKRGRALRSCKPTLPLSCSLLLIDLHAWHSVANVFTSHSALSSFFCHNACVVACILIPAREEGYAQAAEVFSHLQIALHACLRWLATKGPASQSIRKCLILAIVCSLARSMAFALIQLLMSVLHLLCRSKGCYISTMTSPCSQNRSIVSTQGLTISR